MTIHPHLDDLEPMLTQAKAAGALVVMEPTDHFYGERSCVLRDPFGHRWLLGREIESVSYEEMQRRFQEMF